MKKSLPIALCIILLSCSKDKDGYDHESKSSSISLKEVIKLSNRPLNNSELGTQSFQVKTTNILFPGGQCVQNTNTSNGVIFNTHGEPDWVEKYIDLSTRNFENVVGGSGVAIRFPFKQGSNYTITIGVRNYAGQISGDYVGSQKRRPELQIQLTNNVTPANHLCAHLDAPVTLVAPGPVNIVPLSESNTQGSLRSIDFSPTECYEFLRLSALPNMTGISGGFVEISSISIRQNSGIEITGPSYLDVNTQGTYNVSYAGLPINNSFTWRVSGGIEIVGSATGSSVVVKSISLAGGTIDADFGGCQSIATIVLPSLNNQYIQLIGPGQINSNITQPARFDINLIGPLQGKTITNTQWSVPSVFSIWNGQTNYLEVFPAAQSGAGFINVNFLLDGSPAFGRVFSKVKFVAE